MFLYPSVKHAISIGTRPIRPYEVLPVKELLISTERPSQYFQVVEPQANGFIVCLDQESNVVRKHRDEVQVVCWYE